MADASQAILKPYVRRATMNDLPRLGPLFHEYRTFYEQEPDLPACFAFVRSRLEERESVIFYADIDGSPAGFCQCYPFFSSLRMCRAWVLNDLFVTESHRRVGVGTMLMEAAEEYATSQCAGEMLLETTEDNVRAQQLYSKRGWVLEKGMRHYKLTLKLSEG